MYLASFFFTYRPILLRICSCCPDSFFPVTSSVQANAVANAENGTSSNATELTTVTCNNGGVAPSTAVGNNGNGANGVTTAAAVTQQHACEMQTIGEEKEENSCSGNGSEGAKAAKVRLNSKG